MTTTDVEPLRVAVIGLGVGEQHARTAAAHLGAELSVICDVDVERLDLVGARFPGARRSTDWNAVVRDATVDVVTVATYDGDHAAHVLAALEHGKHVFVEKPLCTRPEDLLAIRDVLRDRPGQRLSSNLVLRREPRFIELHERIRTGRLGRPFLLEGSYDYGRVHKLTDGWRGREHGYSVMHGGGIHLIDLLLWLKGDGEVEEVVAYGSGLATEDTAFAGRDLALALLKFSDGTLARVSANFASVTPHHHQVSVYGTAGTFHQTHTGAGYLWSKDPVRPLRGSAVDAGQAIETDVNPYPVASKGELFGAFLDRLRGVEADAATESETLAAMAVSIAIEASIVRGGPVRVEEFAG